MARHVFFTFHYQNDIWRVNQVRNSWVVTTGNTTQQFYDRSLWEAEQRKGDAAIQRLIDNGMKGASVTCVLIGSETADRKWVDYEIEKSFKDGMGLFGVRIHKLKHPIFGASTKGKNPFESWHFSRGGQTIYFSQEFPVYDWVDDDGYHNFARWVEAAARKAGR